LIDVVHRRMARLRFAFLLVVVSLPVALLLGGCSSRGPSGPIEPTLSISPSPSLLTGAQTSSPHWV